MSKWVSWMKKEGWLLALAALAVALCLLGTTAGAKQGGQTQEEARLSSILSAMEGVGQARAVIFTDKDAQPVGVVVVADGARDVSVQLRVTRTVMTLLRVQADQIVVCSSKEGTT